MQAESLFKSGQLTEAVDAQLSFVKKNPSDTHARFFLAELASFQGDWDRVDRQLDAIAAQDSKVAMLPMLFRQLVRAEILREQVFFEGRAPELVVSLAQDCQLQLEACTALRLGQYEDCKQLLERADSERQLLHGTCDGKSFETLLDADDRLRGIAEILTASGKYFWVPWNSIQSLEFSKPERPMDLIWRKASISVKDGPEGEVYIPTRYPQPNSWTDEERLGRTTTWVEHANGIVTGVGQRTLLVEEDGIPLLEIGQIIMDSTGEGTS